MFYVYALRSLTHGSRYIGSADNSEKRLAEHNAGKCRHTRGRRPWVLIHLEQFTSRSEAMKRERFLKSGQGGKLLDDMDL